MTLLADADQALETELDTWKEPYRNSFEMVRICIIWRVNLRLIARACFVTVFDKIGVIADIADCGLILEQNDSHSEDASESPCKTTKVAQKVKQSVNFTSDDSKIPI